MSKPDDNAPALGGIDAWRSPLAAGLVRRRALVVARRGAPAEVVPEVRHPWTGNHWTEDERAAMMTQPQVGAIRVFDRWERDGCGITGHRAAVRADEETPAGRRFRAIRALLGPPPEEAQVAPGMPPNLTDIPGYLDLLRRSARHGLPSSRTESRRRSRHESP